ncbi:MAG TPA: NAD+ synthase [Acidimicrobiales bacterium]
MPSIRVGLAQINPVVGDLSGNVERIAAAMASAEEQSCDLLALPELSLTGYPPEDLVLRPSFVRDNLVALGEVVSRSGRCVTVVGFVDTSSHPVRGARGHVDDDVVEQWTIPPVVHNAAAVCAGGQLLTTYRKRLLPNYSVFDERRYFVPGAGPHELLQVGEVLVGVSICEDAWSADGPILEMGKAGASLVLNINASPFNLGKRRARSAEVQARARQSGAVIAYVNQVGGQDELVFDGDSMVVGADGAVLARAPQFTEDLFVVDVDVPAASRDPGLRVVTAPSAASAGRPSIAPVGVAPEPSEDAEVWEALVLGTRDFVRKNGFSEVVIGLSGGIDSALVAAIAVDALGPEHVHGVLMPSRYSSDHSISDAEALASNLGIEHRTVPIEPAHVALMGMLAPSFGEHPPGLTEENLQSRIRAVILMGLSNAFGWLLLNTGNKSESSVGYSTLYGDSAGGYAVIKDVAKLRVYSLCRYRNGTAGRALIPESVLEKPPSAELRPDQRDDQSLPPYEVLDPILALYVEQDLAAEDIVASGHDPEIVDRVIRLVDLAEYKRRQSPPGPRVTPKGFGKDRRLPIVNRYRR